MKTLKESLLSDIDTTLARGEDDAILSMIFSKNLEQRREAFNMLRIMVESYHLKQHKTTAKMKNSDSYFIEFTFSLDVQNWINSICIGKRTLSSYQVVSVNASEDVFGDKIYAYRFDWMLVRSYFNPKASNTKLYEVPKELNNLFERIQTEAYNHRQS